jgi:hypothetical protein
MTWPPLLTEKPPPVIMSPELQEAVPPLLEKLLLFV